MSSAIAVGVSALLSTPPKITTDRGRWRRPWRMSSPFVAAAACEALCGAETSPGPFAAYLRSTREPDGSWMFEPHGRRWPPDADSTSCAIAALTRVEGSTSQPIVRRIIGEQRADDGLIRPWLHWYPGATQRMDANASDAIVTANVVFAARRVSEDCDILIGALEDHVTSRGLAHLTTVYYDSLPLRAYYLARALGEGAAAEVLRDVLATLDGDVLPGVDAAAALAAAALLGMESTVSALLPRVVALQQADGGWPEGRWFTDPANYVWRSQAFSTALAVEALSVAAG